MAAAGAQEDEGVARRQHSPLVAEREVVLTCALRALAEAKTLALLAPERGEGL